MVEYTPDKRKVDRSIRSRPKCDVNLLLCVMYSLFGLAVRTLPFHGRNMGSIPIRDYLVNKFLCG